jgi:hypothetical protein
MMRSYFEYSGLIVSDEEDLENPEQLTLETSPPDHPNDLDPMPETIGYGSDTSNDKLLDTKESEDNDWEDNWPEGDQAEADESRGMYSEKKTIEPQSQPRQKWQKLDIPVLKACAAAHENKHSILKSALVNIQKLI